MKQVLQYLWIGKYRCIEKQGFNFTRRVTVQFDYEAKKLTIENNEDYCEDFFDDSIELSCIVGKNGVGKTTILRVIKEMVLSHMENVTRNKAYFHLPGLFEFYDLYSVFLPLYREHREYFYDWCEIASVYGAPADCIWSGGRAGFGECEAEDVLALMNEYGISSRLTFSNSLLKPEHLTDRKCNALCELFAGSKGVQNGVIIHSELLLEHIKNNYPGLYFVSSTTKVQTDFGQFLKETERCDFKYVVPDFRLNKLYDKLDTLSQIQKDKVEFLCNECCSFYCKDRKACYENVSRKNLGENCPEHICTAPDAKDGYRFSKAMKNPGFISTDDIINTYLPLGFSNFKIEGRGLGSAVNLEFLLYYLTKPEYQLTVREEIYLDSMLDLF